MYYNSNKTEMATSELLQKEFQGLLLLSYSKEKQNHNDWNYGLWLGEIKNNVTRATQKSN
jgi:hypothetical protein